MTSGQVFSLLTGRRAAPIGASLQNLIVNGQFFARADGTRWSARECSDFNLLNRWQNGENITPQLSQRSALGFNLLRVWTLYDIPGIGSMPICAYHRIPEFVGLCATYGLYVEFTAYTGINDPLHWEFLCDAARKCAPRPLLELVNELDQNTNEPDSAGRVFRLEHFSQPEGLLSSHGSNGSQAVPVQPYWNYATFHTNGASEEQRKIGHNAMELSNGPVLTNETSRFPDGGGLWAAVNRELLAFDAASGAALLCAGSCFHSVQGKTSALFDVNHQNAAKSWTSGAATMDLECQPGPYTHRADLETPALLRVYERPVSGHACIVDIHK